MEKELIDLGFSKNSAKVYLALLELGDCAISRILEKTELHPQIVYNSLGELRKQGYATYTIKNSRRYFKANSPKHLVEEVKEKLNKAEEILPALLKKAKGTGEQNVFVFSGEKEFRKVRLNVIRSIPKGEIYYVLGSGGKHFYQVMEGSYWESERIRIRRGVYKKIIAYEDVANYLESLRKDKSKMEERHTLPGIYENPTTTIFGGNKLALLIWSKPTLSILIENKELVESYKAYFEILWNQAKIG